MNSAPCQALRDDIATLLSVSLKEQRFAGGAAHSGVGLPLLTDGAGERGARGP